MRKKILLLLALILCMTIFVNNANAVESDATMVLWCDNFVNIDLGTVLPDEFYNVEQAVFYKLTKESGSAVYKYALDKTFGYDISENFGGWRIGNELVDPIITLNEGKCPRTIIAVPGTSPYLFGTQNPAHAIKLERARYIAYQIKKGDTIYKIIEGYSKDGRYGYAGVDIQNISNTNLIKLAFTDEVSNHQIELIENVGLDKYFKVDEYFESTIIAGNGEGAIPSLIKCKDLNEQECHNKNGYEVLISSSEEGRKNLKQELTDWLNNENNVILEGYNKISSLSKDSKFINTCKEIEEANDNSEKYDLSKISIDNFIDKLSEGFEALNEAYNVTFNDCGTNQKTSPASAVVSCAIYSDKLQIREIADFAAKNKDYMTNQNFLVYNIYSDVKDILKEILNEKGYDINIIDAASDLNKYTKSFYTAALYLNSKGELSETQKDKLKDIIDNYKGLIDTKGLGISPVVDCQTLLGDNLINKIRSYTNIIKIAIPIILIVFGIIDFTKAIFAGEDEMQKAKKQFITRIAIAVLIFIAPTIISLLLQLANKVWTIISPDSCGIF